MIIQFVTERETQTLDELEKVVSKQHRMELNVQQK